MNSHDIRWIQRFDNFKRAFGRLSEAAVLASQRKLSNLEEQGLIQAFEFTHELAWKTLKEFLESRGASPGIYGSRDATREAFAVGLLTDGEVWMNMIAHRNESSHTYNQQTADAIAQAILTRYVAEFALFFQLVKLSL